MFYDKLFHSHVNILEIYEYNFFLQVFNVYYFTTMYYFCIFVNLNTFLWIIDGD